MGAAGVVAACSDGDTRVDPDRAPGFREVAADSGIDFTMRFLAGEQGADFKINLYDHGAGVSVADVDGDRIDDVYLLNQLGPNALFRSRGDGTFEDITAKAGVALSDRICTSASFADFDNDGDQDLFVASTRGGNTLFTNDGSGAFTDTTEAAGLSLVAHSQGVAFFDYDRDGWLDLFVTNTAEWTNHSWNAEGRYYTGKADFFDLVESRLERNRMYRNLGDGTFEDTTRTTGLAGLGWGGDIAVFDYDNDGDPDLFVTNMFGASQLYRNDDGQHFADVTEEVLKSTSWGAVGCKPLDVDRDGLLDLYVVDMHSDMWIPPGIAGDGIVETRKYKDVTGPLLDWEHVTQEQADEYVNRLGGLNPLAGIFGNSLYRNAGEGRMEEVSDAVGAENFWPWGIASADFDQNGYEDAFIPCGMGHPFFIWRNLLLMNDDGHFEMRETSEGIEPRPDGPRLDVEIDGKRAASSSRSAAVIDLLRDGRPDLIVNNFNERAYVYRNEFPAKSWVAFRLRGTRSNRDAVGAVVRVYVGRSVMVRQVNAAGGYLAQSTKSLLFGLDDAKAIDRVEIRWPSGDLQTLEGIELGRYHEVVEPE